MILVDDDVATLVQDTIAALLTLRHAEHLPEASRSYWLRTVARVLAQFDLDEESERWPEPDARQLEAMRRQLSTLDALRSRDESAFQVIFMRTLTHPVSGRHLMTWNDIARALRMQPLDVRAAYWRGVEIVSDLAQLRPDRVATA